MHSNRLAILDGFNRVRLILIEQDYDLTSSSCECVDVILDVFLSSHSDLASVNVHSVRQAVNVREILIGQL
jgi:hypothetical protein